MDADTKRKNRRAILVCSITGPLTFYLLHSWSSLIAMLRPDVYSYGILFYLLAIAVCLVSNALIIKWICGPMERNELIRLAVKSALIGAAVLAGVLLIFWTVYFVAMTTGHWSFG